MTTGVTVLFLCTGNTCRSPLAEHAARDIFNDNTYTFSSAGTEAVSGRQATDEVLEAATERGLDLTGHTTTHLSECEAPDIIYCMEGYHLIAAAEEFPGLDSSMIRLLDHPYDISDPYGLGPDAYMEMTVQIIKALKTLDLSSFK